MTVKKIDRAYDLYTALGSEPPRAKIVVEVDGVEHTVDALNTDSARKLVLRTTSVLPEAPEPVQKRDRSTPEIGKAPEPVETPHLVGPFQSVHEHVEDADGKRVLEVMGGRNWVEDKAIAKVVKDALNEYFGTL